MERCARPLTKNSCFSWRSAYENASDAWHLDKVSAAQAALASGGNASILDEHNCETYSNWVFLAPACSINVNHHMIWGEFYGNGAEIEAGLIDHSCSDGSSTNDAKHDICDSGSFDYTSVY